MLLIDELIWLICFWRAADCWLLGNNSVLSDHLVWLAIFYIHSPKVFRIRRSVLSIEKKGGCFCVSLMDWIGRSLLKRKQWIIAPSSFVHSFKERSGVVPRGIWEHLISILRDNRGLFHPLWLWMECTWCCCWEYYPCMESQQICCFVLQPEQHPSLLLGFYNYRIFIQWINFLLIRKPTWNSSVPFIHASILPMNPTRNISFNSSIMITTTITTTFPSLLGVLFPSRTIPLLNAC